MVYTISISQPNDYNAKGNWYYEQHKHKKWFNYNNGLHNFHTIVFTIIPSTITKCPWIPWNSSTKDQFWT
jgi:hypothetical protein